MPIIWRDSMSVGHSVIDEDHKKLLGILNDFEVSTDFEMAQLTAKKLYSYTQHHFTREERIQRTSGYPYLEAHKAEHEALLHRLRAIIKEHFVEKKAAHEEQPVIADIHALMKDWIVDHVIKTDLRLKPFLRKIPH